MVHIYPPFIFGDTNEDLEISYIDAVLVIKHLLQLSQLEGFALNAADVSGNGVISSFDAALILQYGSDIISCFPADGPCEPGKKQIVAEESQGYPVNEFRWSSLPELPGSTTLDLEQSQNSTDIYSLDVSMSSSDSIPAIRSYLPEGWIWYSHWNGNRLVVSMAGPTPLLDGPVLSFQGSINASQIAVNGMSLSSDSEINSVPQLKVMALYPTPFNQAATLHYSITHATTVTISLFDILGRRIRRLFSGPREAGKHQVLIDGQSLSTGIYFVHVGTAGGHFEAARIIKN